MTETVSLTADGEHVELTAPVDDAGRTEGEDETGSGDGQNDGDATGDDSIPGLGIVSGLAGLGAAAGRLLTKTDTGGHDDEE